MAAALELLHLFALIQDDVMDRSDSRRGRTTLHVSAAQRHLTSGGLGDPVLFGDSVATLVSDLALSEASLLVAPCAPDVRAAWRLMAVELVEGQLLDLTHTAGRRRDVETSRRIARFKSSRYTISRPVQLGALVGGADPALVRGLIGWGDLVGDAFAVRDDLLGVWGDPVRTGKPAGDDLRSGKPTVLSWAAELLPAAPGRCSPPATRAPSTTPGSTPCSAPWPTPGWSSAPSAPSPGSSALPPRPRRAGGRPARRRRPARARREHRLEGHVRVVVIGAGSAGSPRPATSPAPATTSRSSSARPPAVAPACSPRRLPLRHRSDRPDDARPAARRRFRAVGADPDRLTLPRLDPAYRAVFADGSELRVRADMGDLREEIRAPAARPRRQASTASSTGSAGSTRRDAAPSSTATTTRRSTSCARPRAAARLLRLGAFGGLGPAVDRFFADDRLHRIFSFQALYAGIAPARALAVLAVITYMDTVRGVFGPEGGMHAVPRAWRRRWRRPGSRIRFGVDGPRGAAPRPTARSPACDSDGELVAADAVVCNADLPVAYDGSCRASARRGAVRGGDYSPSAVVWHVGACGPPGRARAPPQHPLRRRLGRSVRGDHRPRRADARPVAPRHRADRVRPDRRARRLDRPLRARTGAQPVAGIDWRARGRPDAGAPARVPRGRRLPDRRPVEELLVTPVDWARPGPAPRHAVRAAPHFRSPARSARRTSTAARPGLVFVGSGRCRAWASRWCSSRQARRRAGEEYAGARAPVPRVVARERPLRPTSTADPLWRGLLALRGDHAQHGTTYYWGAGAPARESRHHVHALYGFCRHADDIVDLDGPDRCPATAAALDALERLASATPAAGASDDPVSPPSCTPCARSASTRECFRRFLRSMAMDLTVARTRRGTTCAATWTARPRSSAR